ncbi:HD domain-containing protein [Algoriphagus terrigena]|uniref:HD domain-containing protein n=1 Tax=Algoriphagus terrigena TaxID=344884 RepID=UPI000408C23C|nr:HD domain-containing protein [Algoriphagus terrigena]
MDKILEEIRDFADQAHGDQMRKYAPDRYIVHPVRVMKMCQEYTDNLPVLAAALLHDVLEDTDTGKEEMLEFLQKHLSYTQAMKVLRLVVELTDVYVKADYPKLNRDQRKGKEAERLAKISPDAQTIKYADIIDNCKEITAHDAHFAPVFLKECRHILMGCKKGNRQLHKAAVETVDQELGKRKQSGGVDRKHFH